MQQENNTAVYTSIFILFAGVTGIGLLIPRYESIPLGMAYISAFFGYFWLCKFPPADKIVFSVGLLLRLLLFIGLPTLSDDIFRFIWDGHLLHAGLSPFAELPIEISRKGNFPPGLSPELFEQLNSKEYFTIYPPLNQLIFWLSAWLGGKSWLASANVIRLILLIGDLATFWILRKLLQESGKDTQLANWYFLNPLVMLEGVGNLHFEVLVIPFLVTGIYYLQKQDYWKSGVGFGLAIATKLLPLIYLPALLFNHRLKKGIIVTFTAFFIAVLSFIPLINPALISSMSASLGLYFQKFEFNASIYFLLREVGYWLKGYNVIGTLGPVLSFLTLVCILGIAVWGHRKKWAIETIMLWSLTTYLLLATTVHPWYILPLIILGLLANYWFPIIWSLLIFATYFGYTPTGFELSIHWVVVEYVVVLSALIIETFNKQMAIKRHKFESIN